MKNMDSILKVKLVRVGVNWWKGKLGPVDESFVEEIVPYSVNGSDGFTCVINHNDKKYGVFMHVGSHNIQNWIDNFNIELVRKMVKQLSDKKNDDNAPIIPYGNTDSKIRMHRGFTSAYIRDTRDLARAFAKKCKDRGLDLIVTGHSYGGAETAVTYIDLHYMFTNELGVAKADMDFMSGYAAASPAVGNKEFVESFVKRADGNFFNEHVLGDPVPQVPGFWMGYKQIPQKWYSDFWNTMSLPFTQVTSIGTLGLLPGVAVWNHHPLRLIFGIQGKMLPPVSL